MADVYHSPEFTDTFRENLKIRLQERFTGCSRILVKTHFGEPGNKYSFTPKDLKPVTDILHELGFEVTLFDTSVMYNSKRHNPDTHKQHALDKGYGELGDVDTDDSRITVHKGEYLEYEVPDTLSEADGVLVLSHLKGHDCSGFGGAVKNLGMGALSKTSKGAIHDGGKAVVGEGCIQCKACENVCPVNGIKVTDKPEISFCIGCSKCILTCPEDVFSPKVELFDTLLGDGAATAQKTFKKDYYVTFAGRIAKQCDCDSNASGPIARDLGWFASEDGVAIDKAALDILNEAEGKNVFLIEQEKDPFLQVQAAEEFGMGSSEYELILP
ncbi:MAG: DUF362 domain-containing protein [Candidatus Woesearchaeota archaeon]